MKEFPRRKKILWDRRKQVGHQIFYYFHNIGDYNAQYNALNTFFAIFQKEMNGKERIPKSLVENYAKEITFLVSTDECIIEVVEPKVVWIDSFGYKIFNNEAEGYINSLQS